MRMIQVKGVPQLMKNLQLAKGTMLIKAGVGLYKAGLFLQRESQKIVPVQKGELKNSAFTRRFNIGMGLAAYVIVGYTAPYTVYVHEDMDKAHGGAFNIKHADEIAHAKANKLKASTAEGGMFNRGENQQAKYLESPARTKRIEMLAIIAAEIK